MDKFFSWDKVSRWFTELKDLGCGRDTLASGLRAFRHLPLALGFEYEAAECEPLMEIAAEWQAARESDPDKADAYTREYLVWMEAYVKNPANPRTMREIVAGSA